MKKKILLAIPLVVLLLSSMALADPYGSYFYDYCRKDTFGESFRHARDAQILNPDARFNLNPVEGQNGWAAEAGYRKYIGSFSQQKGASESGTVGFVPMVTSPPGGGK